VARVLSASDSWCAGTGWFTTNALYLCHTMQPVYLFFQCSISRRAIAVVGIARVVLNHFLCATQVALLGPDTCGAGAKGEQSRTPIVGDGGRCRQGPSHRRGRQTEVHAGIRQAFAIHLQYGRLGAPGPTALVQMERRLYIHASHGPGHLLCV